MNFIINCKSCRETISFSKGASDRIGLASKIGEVFIRNCNNCGHSHHYHIDEVTAITRKSTAIISLFILVFGTSIVLIFVFPFIHKIKYIYAMVALLNVVFIPFLIYITIKKAESNKLKRFNRYKLKGALSAITFERR